MQNDIFKNKLINYWRDIDKKIFLAFITLFCLGLFFSFSSTFLAGERLNKDDYFFFSKHFFYITSNDDNGYYINA